MDEMDIFSVMNKDPNTITNKRTNFRLNYNPYNLRRSIEENYDKKQLNNIRKMALENQQGKPIANSTKNSNSGMDKLIYEDEKKYSNLSYIIYNLLNILFNYKFTIKKVTKNIIQKLLV